MICHSRKLLTTMAVAAGLMLGNAAHALSERLTLAFTGEVQSYSALSMGWEFLLGNKSLPLPCPHMRGTILVDQMSILSQSPEHPNGWVESPDQDKGQLHIDTTQDPQITLIRGMVAPKDAVLERVQRALQSVVHEVCKFSQDSSGGYQNVKGYAVMFFVDDGFEKFPSLFFCSPQAKGSFGVAGKLQNLDGLGGHWENGTSVGVTISPSEILVRNLGADAMGRGGWQSAVDRVLSAACGRSVSLRPAAPNGLGND